MDVSSQRANGFILPGEDPDQLVAAAQSAIAVVPQLNATIAALQQQNQQMQQRMQQLTQESQSMVTAMMLQAKDMQAQLTTGRLTPVLPQVVMHSGLMANLPMSAMTNLSMSRTITPEGEVSEQFQANFDPGDVLRAQGERALNRGTGIARINQSKSLFSKLMGRYEDY